MTSDRFGKPLITYHFESYPKVFCDPGVYPRYLTGLSIPPGQIGTIPFTTSSWEVAENKPLFRTFYVEHANHHLDDNLIDNHVQLTYLTSKIDLVIENDMAIWPNPFLDHLITSQDFENISMYNHLGNIVATGINRLDNLKGLASGIYYVHGYKNQKSFFSRVIKVE